MEQPCIPELILHMELTIMGLHISMRMDTSLDKVKTGIPTRRDGQCRNILPTNLKIPAIRVLNNRCEGTVICPLTKEGEK